MVDVARSNTRNYACSGGRKILSSRRRTAVRCATDLLSVFDPVLRFSGAWADPGHSFLDLR